MATRRYVVSMAGDTTFPRDRVVNTLYLNHTAEPGIPADVDQMVDDVVAVWDFFWCGSGVREITCKAYELGGPPPHFPVAEHTRNLGLAPQSNIPREVAICLSFRADQNTKRRRGRMFLPVFTCGSAGPVRDLLTVRPSTALRDRGIVMANEIANLGGVDVDWSVWSGMDNAARKVEHAWVDDEWDTQRRRGLRASTRTEQPIGE